MLISNIYTAVSGECFRAFVLKSNDINTAKSLRSWGNCLLGCSYRKIHNPQSTNPHITVLLLTWCGYSHHFCWSGWHLVCVISGVSQSCCLFSAHWMTKATDSSRPKALIQMGMLRNCIHQLRVGREVRNCAAPQLNTTAICFTYQTIVVRSEFPTVLACSETALQNPMRVCVYLCIWV